MARKSKLENVLDYVKSERIKNKLIRQMLFIVVYFCMAYSIHGYISYILEANSKRPIKEKRKEIKVMLKKLNGVIFFLFQQKYFIMHNFFLCAFKLMMIKSIVYIQCKRWVIKLSFKRKALGEYFLCHKKKIVLCKEEFYA